jgi:hypothetical protein
MKAVMQETQPIAKIIPKVIQSISSLPYAKLPLLSRFQEHDSQKLVNHLIIIWMRLYLRFEFNKMELNSK